MPNILDKIQSSLYKGEEVDVEEATRKAVEEGFSAKEILDDGLIKGMDAVGKDFKAGQMFIPEVMLCAKAMHAGLEVIRPLLAESGEAARGKIVIGTVSGDLHDIGKNLVSMMFQGAGFDVIDLGVDVSPEEFVAVVQTENPTLVGMSALLTTTMPSMKSTVDLLIKEGLRDQVKVLIGGAPVTTEYASEIGADSFASDAGSAVEAALALIA